MLKKVLLSLNLLALVYLLITGRPDVKILTVMVFPMWLMSFNRWRNNDESN